MASGSETPPKFVGMLCELRAWLVDDEFVDQTIKAVNEEYFKKPRDENGTIIDIGSWVRGEVGNFRKVSAIAIDKYDEYLLRLDDGDGSVFWHSLLEKTEAVSEPPKSALLREYAEQYGSTPRDERDALTERYVGFIEEVS